MDPFETSSVPKTVNSRPEVAYGILCLSFYPPSSDYDTKVFDRKVVWISQGGQFSAKISNFSEWKLGKKQ